MLKMLKTTKFPKEYSEKVDFSKVSLDSIKPWVARRITAMLGFEDEVVIGLVYNMIENMSSDPDPRKLQLSISDFFESKTQNFVLELWKLLLSAQDSPGGVPAQFIEEKLKMLESSNTSVVSVPAASEDRASAVRDRYSSRSRSRSRSRQRERRRRHRRYSSSSSRSADRRRRRRRRRSSSPRSRHSRY
jgi:hypothetical protein